ncbi:hypothetical protein HZH68_000324 [Vespula germanica]|uniref:Uncharacterized protein n=1 Tax=Vespula germanica TaxID=30212 RepID=A0A834NTE4_VESGE|nr:hypothetical protein HZH68_000324 [Vespula germanica]
MTLSASQLVSTRSSNKKQRARTIEDYDEGISIITIGNPPGLHQQRNVLHHHLTAGYHGSHNFIQERDQGILFRRLLPSSKYVRDHRSVSRYSWQELLVKRPAEVVDKKFSRDSSELTVLPDVLDKFILDGREPTVFAIFTWIHPTPSIRSSRYAKAWE